jgi:hypothetical protein
MTPCAGAKNKGGFFLEIDLTVFRRMDKRTLNHECVAPSVVVEPVMTVRELDDIEGRIATGWRLKDDLDKLVYVCRRVIVKRV